MKRIIAFAGAVLMLCVTIWCAVPAPNLVTLGFAIGIPELALPVGALFVAVSIGLVLLVHGIARAAVGALCLLSLALLTAPLSEVPGAWTRADAALATSGIAALHGHPQNDIDVIRAFPVPLRDGSALALDLYRPHDGAVHPLIVTIYGGAWHVGSRAEDAPLARWYAAHGFAVAVIDYRHAPAYRYPLQLEDVDDALNTIFLHAEAWHVDRNRVALFGRSAGAQLALRAGEQIQMLHVRAIVAYYAPTDLVRGYAEPPQPDPAGVRGILRDYLGGPPDTAHLALYRAASPLMLAHAGMPPVLAIIGARDELVRPEFQRAFAARLDALHVRNVAIVLPWSNHAFDAVNGLGSAVARYATVRFLDTLL